METFTGEDYPESMGEKEKELFKILLMSNEVLTRQARMDGVSPSMVLSMFMSASITFLNKTVECEHCVAEILKDAGTQLLADSEPHNERVTVGRGEGMEVIRRRSKSDGTVH